MKTLSFVLRKLIVGVYVIFVKLFKTETSKWILRFCDGILLGTLIMIFVGWFQMLDVSYMVGLIPPLCGLCATAHGFYFWKSKIENCRKYPDIMECLKNGIQIPTE